MQLIEHVIPELLGGAGAYALHAAHHKLFHVAHRCAIRALAAVRG